MCIGFLGNKIKMGNTPCIESRNKTDSKKIDEINEEEKKQDKSKERLGILKSINPNSKSKSFYFGHFSDGSISCCMGFINYQTKTIITCNSVLIDSGFTGSILVSNSIAKLLDLRDDALTKNFSLGDSSSIWGSEYKSLDNRLILMGRDEKNKSSQARLVEFEINTSIFAPDESSDDVLLGLQFLESLGADIKTLEKVCLSGYNYEKKNIKA